MTAGERARREAKPVERFQGDIGTKTSPSSPSNPSSGSQSTSTTASKQKSATQVKKKKTRSKTSHIVTEAFEGT
jgi:hypothetical protein